MKKSKKAVVRKLWLKTYRVHLKGSRKVWAVLATHRPKAARKAKAGKGIVLRTLTKPAVSQAIKRIVRPSALNKGL